MFTDKIDECFSLSWCEFNFNEFKKLLHFFDWNETLIVLDELKCVADVDCRICESLHDSLHDLIDVSDFMGRIQHGIVIQFRNSLDFLFRCIFVKEILVFNHDSILVFKLELALFLTIIIFKK